jgi:phosphoribosylformylglycinamidine synthase
MISVIEPTKRVVFVELGPRLNFSTAWSTNAINIFRSCGLNKVLRIEQSRCLLLRLSNRATIDAEAFRKAESQFVSSLYDRMTEMIYKEPLTSFKLNMTPEVCVVVVRMVLCDFLT